MHSQNYDLWSELEFLRIVIYLVSLTFFVNSSHSFQSIWIFWAAVCFLFVCFFRGLTQLQGTASYYKRIQDLFCNACIKCRAQMTTWAVKACIINPPPTHSANSARFIKRLTNVVNFSSKPMVNFEWILTDLWKHIWHVKVQLFFLLCHSWSYFGLYDPGTQAEFRERQSPWN